MILEKARAARTSFYAHGFKTPLIASKSMGSVLECDLWFKAEQFQRTGSFKFRGAYNKLSAATGKVSFVTASSGNHGIACATAAKLLQRELIVFLPENVSPTKRSRIEQLGVAVKIAGTESGETERIAMDYAVEQQNTQYISPYNDADIIAGQAIVGLELLEQLPRVDNVFIALGGGGLVSGIGSVIKAIRPDARIIGVSAENSAELDACWRAGRHVATEHKDTLADGVAGGVDPQSITIEIASEVIDDCIACNEDEIAEQIRVLAFEESMLVEGSAALALAGLVQQRERFAHKSNIVVLCGGNFDTSKIAPLLSMER